MPVKRRSAPPPVPPAAAPAGTPAPAAAPADGDGFWPETLVTWIDALQDGDAERRRQTLDRITTHYRKPILRRILADAPDLSAQDAEDLCHQFLLDRVLAPGRAGKSVLDTFDQTKGRLRDYLGAALRNFLLSWRRKRGSQKRGGGVTHLTLEEWDGPARLKPGRDTLNPEFDREWALHIFADAFRALERQWLRDAAHASRYAALRPFLLGEASDTRQKELAADLGMTPAALRQCLSRLRQDWRRSLHNTIAPTVSTPADVEEELRYLCEILSQ